APSARSPSSYQCPLPPPHLYSFPTRRSSDLHRPRNRPCRRRPRGGAGRRSRNLHCLRGGILRRSTPRIGERLSFAQFQDGFADRSEEHTSELQSRFDLVCRLLLEQKKWS